MDTDRTLHTTRLLPFAADVIYAAFETPDHLAAWWGPAGFTNTFEVFEFRPGGRWEFVMHGPDGSHYPNRSEFQVLEPAARVVIRHVNAPQFTLTVQLQPAQGGTRVDWTQTFDDPEVARAVRAICEPANEQNLDRLEALLTQAAG